MNNQIKKIPSHSTNQIEEGKEYEWLYDVYCRDGSIMHKGSTILIIEKTGMTPHNEIMDCGYNFLCKAVNGITVWATLVHCFDRGLLRLVK